MIKTNSLDELLKDNSVEHLNFTLKGLVKGHLGMLIAAPNVGKSHLALCIAIEHASSAVLVGLTERIKPKKTLVLSSEDSTTVLKLRMQEKMKNFSSGIKRELKQNLHFLTDIPPLVIPPESSSASKLEHEVYLEELTKMMMDFDLVIIDTVTESIGECDEVRHDRLIKNTFQSLAKKANCSILLIHHVNKDEIRGNQKITMASGAGLTSVMRLTKCLFTLTLKDEKRTISFLKSNYLNDHDAKDISLEIANGLTVNPKIYKQTSRVVRKEVSDEVYQEPKAITLSGSIEVDTEIEDRKSLRQLL